MTLSPRIAIRQSQKLVLNPQMQQSIELLLLSNKQLAQMLKKETEQNPFLAFDTQHYREATASKAQTQEAQTPDVYETMTDFAEAESGNAGDVIEQRQAELENGGLLPHVLGQIGEMFDDRQMALWAGELAGWLDEDGYLREGDDEICAALSLSQSDLDAVLTQCRALSPAGVFARDLPDCLALQIHRQAAWTPAYGALLANLGLVAKNDFAQLAEICAVEARDIMDMLRLVQTLDPRPGRAFQQEAANVQAPEILVQGGQGKWQASLNEDSLPRVLVLERDWEEMAQRAMSDDEKTFMKTNIRSARWLRKAMQQRAATLLRVAEAVTARQQGFFDHGMIALTPMSLRDIGEALELHESTISRTVARKTIATPKGVFALKDLFSVRVTPRRKPRAQADRLDNQPIVSARSVQARIAALIEAETAGTVLSDTRIVKILAKDNVIVARRTVAKYRDMMHIPSSVVRRRKLALKA